MLRVCKDQARYTWQLLWSVCGRFIDAHNHSDKLDDAARSTIVIAGYRCVTSPKHLRRCCSTSPTAVRYVDTNISDVHRHECGTSYPISTGASRPSDAPQFGSHLCNTKSLACKSQACGRAMMIAQGRKIPASNLTIKGNAHAKEFSYVEESPLGIAPVDMCDIPELVSDCPCTSY